MPSHQVFVFQMTGDLCMLLYKSACCKVAVLWLYGVDGMCRSAELEGDVPCHLSPIERGQNPSPEVARELEPQPEQM